MRGLLHPDDRERARLAVEQAIEFHSQYNTEYRVLRRPGDLGWYRLVALRFTRRTVPYSEWLAS